LGIFKILFKNKRREILKLRLVAAGIAATLALVLLPSTAMAGDKDCSDFSSWKAAQRFYKNHGGPKRDPHRLDGDRDGIACERLRY
jgi:excalibur calcium-binding domain-containing protein